jgi:hypothetical protein
MNFELKNIPSLRKKQEGMRDGYNEVGCFGINRILNLHKMTLFMEARGKR